MASATAATAKAVERMGMGMIAPEAGIAAFQAVLLRGLAGASAVESVVPFKWDRFMPRLSGAPAMFEEFAGAGAASAATVAGASAGMPAAQARAGGAAGGASAEEQRQYVLGQVQEAVASVLGAPVGLEDPLMAAGLDSLGTVELRNALESRAGIELPATMVFDYPTINALTGFLATKLITSAAAADGLPEAGYSFDLYEPYTTELARAEGGAAERMIGISELVVRTPGDAFLTTQPSDQPRQVPLERWDLESLTELCGGMPVMFGGFLKGIAEYDPAAFGISEAEAALVDPQQRLLMETSTEAVLQHPQELGSEALRNDWGVFVVSYGRRRAEQRRAARLAVPLCRAAGCPAFAWCRGRPPVPTPGLQGVSGMDYNRLAARHIQGVTAYSATGTALSAVSGRVSYTLRFRGPAVTVDTACSSSLVAMHAAASAVLSRRASLAINAGVNICMMPDTPAMFQRAGMTTANGRRVCGACISLTLARSDPREALHGTSYCALLLYAARTAPGSA